MANIKIHPNLLFQTICYLSNAFENKYYIIVLEAIPTHFFFHHNCIKLPYFFINIWF